MEKVNFQYSLKNIPLASRVDYKRCLIHKAESFLKRIRWKAYFFNNEDKNDDVKNNYGFKSIVCPPQDSLLNDFETDIME